MYGLTISQIAERVAKKALKKKALTGAELAARAGFSTPQSINRGLGFAVASGKIRRIPGRKPTYLAAA